MKLSAIAIAIAFAFAGFAGTASAAGQEQTLPSVTVAGARLSECTPPNGTTGHSCDAFNQLVRANFSSREIGMLFGYRTSYPENLTGGIDRLQRRYQAVVRDYLAAQQQAGSTQIAVK